MVAATPRHSPHHLGVVLTSNTLCFNWEIESERAGIAEGTRCFFPDLRTDWTALWISCLSYSKTFKRLVL
ncbi:hypothetical protein SDJN03_19782, partial [Cucurbita argyrosperma subsp. sororia]